MATRSRRVEYVFDQRTTTLATATRFDLSAITLTIAETSSRTFTSVIVDVRAQENAAATGTITAALVGIKLGAVAFSDQTFSIGNGASGDSYGMQYTRDVTSYFNTNFGSGSTQTCQVGVTFTGSSTINHTVKITICYTFDDSSATTRTKTVKIPLESGIVAMTTSLVEIGTNQVPDLSSFLPEASITYKSVWFEVLSNSGANATTDANLALSLDAEAEASMGTEEMGGQDARWTRHLWRRDDMTTNATHAFKARVTNTSIPYACLSVILHVTYTYDHSSSTRILNSLELAIGNGGMLGYESGTRPSKTSTSFTIQEPGTITLLQSGVLFTYLAYSMENLIFSCGSSSTRTYAQTGANGPNSSGPCSVIQRVDSGSAAGAGISIARGNNTFTTTAYTSNGGGVFPGGNQGGILYLNYSSDKHTSGDGVHAHTIVQHISSLDLANGSTNDYSTWTVAPSIPETSYYLTNVGLYVNLEEGNTPTGAIIEVETKTSDNYGLQAWALVYTGCSFAEYCDSEQIMTLDITRFWLTSPGRLNQLDRLDIETSRQWRMFMVGSIGGSGIMYKTITYHAITYALSGSIADFGGDGSGVTVVALDASTHAPVASATTAVGGSFTITTYDNTTTYYTVAREDDTHTGRSANGVAS